MPSSPFPSSPQDAKSSKSESPKAQESLSLLNHEIQQPPKSKKKPTPRGQHDFADEAGMLWSWFGLWGL